ncbi:cysteine-rich CWC family protein [Ideonella livida]|uniref:Cysteine-rich CWC family protein n=1 Tax=Ideonella livida TaxID=2707176 RepID=A0A7C9PG56_9BURK|nr:cysteine-rich CWC family protein [Ideonella livida]NDY91053.1 cysteine-rich CWC family protein [Ideonella livida]
MTSTAPGLPPDSPPDTSPNACRCPLCGGPNGCTPATTGQWTADCWCTTVRIEAAVLARVPAAQAGRACVCRACAAGQGALESRY